MKEIVRIAELAGGFRDELNVRPEIHWDDFIFRFLIDNPTFPSEVEAIRYYFQDGRKSAETLKSILSKYRLWDRGDLSVLEFASGYGCVSRHFGEVMPSVRLVISDIHPAAMAFAQEVLGLAAFPSHRDPREFCPDTQFDCIFALSFFSHMPRSTWGAWLKALWDATAHGGLLVFTTQGPTSAKYLGDPMIPADGFWYSATSEQKDLSTEEYGQTIVTHQFVEVEALVQTGQRLTEYSPAFWWGHQDLYVMQKP